jgi:hypothetical protein
MKAPVGINCRKGTNPVVKSEGVHRGA